MKHKSLLFLQITSDDYTGLCIENAFSPLGSYLFSTGKVPSKSLINKVISLIFMLVSAFPMTLNAQLSLQGTVQKRVNDPTVTVNVDRQLAKKGETVTITLDGLTGGKTAEVKAGRSFGSEDVPITGEGESYTFVMPNHPVYIDVKIQPSGTGDGLYALSVETPGVSAGKVTVAVTGEPDGDVVADGTSYRVKAGAKVTAKLQTPLAPRLSLLSVRGYAPDGSWQLTPLVGTGGKEPTEVTFTMPAAAAVIRFAIHEESIDPGPGPTPGPVYYGITIPAVEGAATDPVAGTYRVKAWDSFLFYLTPDKDHGQSVAVVTTDRGDVLAPRGSDGAYVVKSVRQDITVRIDGIRPNPPVANEEVGKEAEGISLYRSGNTLYVQSDRASSVGIYTFGGSLVRTVKVEAGVLPVGLPRGAYIVRMGEKSQKVIF